MNLTPNTPLKNIWGNVTIGEGTKVAAFVEIGGTGDNPTTIGEGCSIQAFAFIPPGTIIGESVFIGPHVCITNDSQPTAHNPDWVCRGVVIENGASIGAGAVILPGVTIGTGAMVGAGAVVTRNVDPHQTVVGNPARRLGYERP